MRSTLVLAVALVAGSAFSGKGIRHGPAPCCTVTIQVRVPAGTGPVYLAGSLPELGPWRPDGRLMEGAGYVRLTSIIAAAGTTVEYKFTLGSSDHDALGPGGTVLPNYRLVVARDTTVVHEITAFK